jgi:Ergosterol biosynthesis ERG4/ERG24 family
MCHGKMRHSNCVFVLSWCKNGDIYVKEWMCGTVHRDLRDEEACQHKYGKDWAKYCALVKYRIVPLLY